MLKRIAYAPLNGGVPHNWDQTKFTNKIIGPQIQLFHSLDSETLQDFFQIFEVSEIKNRVNESMKIQQLVQDPSSRNPSTWLFHDPFESYQIPIQHKITKKFHYTSHGLPSAVYCSVELTLLSYMTEIVLRNNGVVLNLEHDGLLIWSPSKPHEFISQIDSEIQTLSQKFLLFPIPVELKTHWEPTRNSP